MVGSSGSLGMFKMKFAKASDSWPTIRPAWLSIPRLPSFVRRMAFLQRFARCVVEACRLTWSSCWLDAYTAAAMKHDVEIGGVLANGPCDQDESLIKR